MGLCIPHHIAASPVHGIGLYTSKPIVAGEVLWRFDPAIDRRVLLRTLSRTQRLSLLHYGYINPLRPEWVVVCGDQARFWNFPPPGATANAEPIDQLVLQEALIVASRSIAAGEELLIHPCSDADYFRKMGLSGEQRRPLCSVTNPDDLDGLRHRPYGDSA